jgi:hypothetical protein
MTAFCAWSFFISATIFVYGIRSRNVGTPPCDESCGTREGC